MYNRPFSYKRKEVKNEADDLAEDKPQEKESRFSCKKLFGKRSMKFAEYFHGKGLTVQDLPKAIICHELMGYAVLGITWGACYHFPMSENPYLKMPMQKALAMVPKCLAEPVNSNPLLASRLGGAYMEAACVRKLMRPITFPGKLFLTYKLVQAIPDITLPQLGNKSKNDIADARIVEITEDSPSKCLFRQRDLSSTPHPVNMNVHNATPTSPAQTQASSQMASNVAAAAHTGKVEPQYYTYQDSIKQRDAINKEVSSDMGYSGYMKLGEVMGKSRSLKLTCPIRAKKSGHMQL
jgi:hypothetical protein